jgi:DNA polymerase-1
MIKRPLILIIDAMSQVYRAYFAIRGLTNSQGVPTNATYGFALMLNRVLEKFPPEYVAMVFDSSEPTPRHIRYPEYKATRPRMPDELAEQLPYIRQLCTAMNVPMLEVSGQEADDVIGTLARRAIAENIHPVIVTIDKDMMQLVTEDTLVLNTSRDDLVIGPEQVKEIYGVTPTQIPDLLGLWGDSSDNIPGAPGIGEKGAKALIERFGSIEACLEHAEEVSAKRQRESLLNNRDQILLSKELVVIDTAVGFDLHWEQMKTQPPDQDALVALLRELDFTSLLKAQLQAANKLETDQAPVEVVQTEDTDLIGDSFAFELAQDRLLAWTGDGPIYDLELNKASALLSDPEKHKVAHDLKAAMLELHRRGLDLVPPYDDTMLMAFLLMPNRGKYTVDGLVNELFGQSAPEGGVNWVGRLHEDLRPKIRQDLEDLYTRIEVPLAPVLAAIEEVGILLDVPVLEAMSETIGAEIEGLTAAIYELAGEVFNINSPKQLGVILFEKLNLPPARKLRKSGQYSTAVEVLEQLAENYELPRLILEYRQRAKFKSTYVDVLPKLIDSDRGRLHTSLNQTGAATGRLSSSDPNLQNIPVRTQMGRDIRAAFIPRTGTTMFSADYSQVELRILAHLSGDSNLIEAFLAGADIHRSTAAEVLGIAAEDVTSDQRSRAKAINFGIVYGQTPYGLAKQLGISRDEAEEFIDRYFKRYPNVRGYIENALSDARETGQTHTLFGRIRQIPEINSRNGMHRSMAERMAINAPIQGTAADIIKLAMIRIHDEINRRKLETRMVLQVHDELIFEVPENEMEVVEQVRTWMSGVTDLKVPLVVDAKIGPNWRDLKRIS